MWVLQKEADEKLFYLLPGKQYTVGRKNADLVLANDSSVSRQHATFTVSINSDQLSSGTDGSPPTVLKLVDNGSKYGTFVKNVKDLNDWRQLGQDEEHIVVNDEIVRFGVLENCWRVIHVPLVCTQSNLKIEEKRHVKNILANLGGTVSTSWSNYSTHLTMKTVTLTIKAICALACAKPIVLPDFWNKYWEMVSNNMKLPDCNDFIPPIGGEDAVDLQSVSLAVNVERCNVFKGKHFVFASQMDLNTLGCMVLAAGGTAAAFEDYIDAFDELCEAHVVVVGCSPLTAKCAPQPVKLVEQFEKARRYLKSRGRRIVGDHEIGIAIVRCSSEQHCNPDYTFGTLDNSQNQTSCVPIDFSSQTVNSQTQDPDSQQSSTAQIHTQTNVSTTVNSMDRYQRPCANTTFDATCTSTKDIFASPVKVSPLNELYDISNKRGRSHEKNELPKPKRPAHSKKVLMENVAIKVESDEEDLFAYPTNTTRVSRCEQIDDDEFGFVNGPTTKEVPQELNQSSEDLFESVPDLRVGLNSSAEKCDEVCESKYIPTKSHEIYQSVASTSKQPEGFQKRKTSFDDESVVPVHKKKKSSNSSSYQKSLSSNQAHYSLEGFLNASLLGSNITDQVDKLSDCINDIFLVEENLLVIRKRAKQAKMVDETNKNELCSGNVKNFKKFRKILPLQRRILPCVIAADKLDVHKEVDMLCNDSPEHSQQSQIEENEDEWNFNASKKTSKKVTTAHARYR